MHVKRFYISAFALLLYCLPLNGRTVLVSSYRLLINACSTAIPGDTIIISPGVYTINDRGKFRIDNRPGPVLVKGATGDPKDVVIQGFGVDDNRMSINFELNNCPRWTFESLTTRNSYFHGFKFDLGSTDCTLRNIIMLDHGESGVKGTSNPAVGIYPDRLLVEDCLIGFTSRSGGNRPNVEGIDGVAVNDWVIRGCTFINIQRGGQPAYACFTKGNSSNTIIENNLFVNCLVGASFGGGGSSPNIFRDNNREFEHRKGIIRNNVFIRCTDAAVYINRADSCKVYNNTVFECALTIQLRFRQTSGFVRNNLVLTSPNNPNEQIVRSRDGGRFLANEGNIKANYSDFLVSSGNWKNLDLHLSSISQAIDAGVDVSKDVLLDYDGNARPKGQNPIDIGAYEYCKSRFLSIDTVVCDSFYWLDEMYYQSGNYTRILANSAGCDSIVHLQLTIVQINTDIIDDGNARLVAVDTGGIYQWLDCEDDYSIIPGETSSSIHLNWSGKFALEIRKGDCIDTSACYSSIYSSVLWVGDGSKSVFPNPVSETLNVDEMFKGQTYIIVNSRGNRVMSGIIRNNTITVSSLSNGIYFIKLYSPPTKSQVFKFVKH